MLKTINLKIDPETGRVVDDATFQEIEQAHDVAVHVVYTEQNRPKIEFRRAGQVVDTTDVPKNVKIVKVGAPDTPPERTVNLRIDHKTRRVLDTPDWLQEHVREGAEMTVVFRHYNRPFVRLRHGDDTRTFYIPPHIQVVKVKDAAATPGTPGPV